VIGSIPTVLEVAFTPVAPFRLAQAAVPPDATRRRRGGVLSMAFPAAGSDATASVWQEPDGRIRARIDCPQTEPAHDRLRELLTVDLDTRPFLRLAAADPLLSPLSARLRGVRPLLVSTPVQALIRAVCGQLIRSSEALAIERRIIAGHGRRHGRFVLPPDAATLASLHPALLERAGLSPQRSVVLTRAARRLRLADVGSDPVDEALRRVLREPGLGRWSAGVVMMYGFGRQEHGLGGDLALVRLAAALGAESDQELLDRYGEWQGLASLWLMRHPLAGQAAARARRPLSNPVQGAR
jgi:3-methyladenine DNA glycosylase/8-oxoguanine DNA glycosylase